MMRKIKLTDLDGKIIHEGYFNTTKEAVEDAIQKHIPLYRVDLRFEDLRNANLDSGYFDEACFQNCNLTGANMSESHFKKCDFTFSILKEACFCYSNIIDCNFKYTQFDETDIAMTIIESCQFQGPSYSSLNFQSCFRSENITYIQNQRLLRNPISKFFANGKNNILATLLYGHFTIYKKVHLLTLIANSFHA